MVQIDFFFFFLVLLIYHKQVIKVITGASHIDILIFYAAPDVLSRCFSLASQLNIQQASGRLDRQLPYRDRISQSVRRSFNTSPSICAPLPKRENLISFPCCHQSWWGMLDIKNHPINMQLNHGLMNEKPLQWLLQRIKRNHL